MNLNVLHPAEQLTRMIKRVYDQRLTTTSGGNLSIKDENGDMWITPASVDKGTLTKEDMVCIKSDGTITGRHRPSSEYPFHQKIYEARKDLKAVLHAHPPALVTMSATPAFLLSGRFRRQGYVRRFIGSVERLAWQGMQ